MNFMDAVNQLSLGKRMVRPAWVGYYVALLPGQSYIWLIGNTNTNPQPNSAEYVPSISDINANDWVVKT